MSSPTCERNPTNTTYISGLGHIYIYIHTEREGERQRKRQRERERESEREREREREREGGGRWGLNNYPYWKINKWKAKRYYGFIGYQGY